MANKDAFIAFKAPQDLAVELKRRAREDDRTLSSFIRRLLAAAMAEHG